MGNVYIGKKNVMIYVTAIMEDLGNEKTEVLARGRAISTAVDAVQVVRERFGQAELENAKIGTDKLDTDEGTRNVSSIKLTLVPAEKS